MATPSAICDPLQHAPLDWTYKGLPDTAIGLTEAELGRLATPLFGGDILFPVAVLHEEIVESNSRWMMEFLTTFGAELAPHGKTTMSPDLMQLQLRNGAWGLSAATVHHVRAYRRWGARRIILANHLVGEAEIAWIAREMARDPQFDFYCLVDSIEGARLLVSGLTAAAPGTQLKVLLEVGISGGRTGVRTLDEGITLAERIACLPGLALSGVETFEGLFQTECDGAARADAMLSTVVALAEHCDRRGLFAPGPVLLSGGGSGLFDLAAEILSRSALSRELNVVVRSGCYIAHDDDMYKTLFETMRHRSPSLDIGGVGLRAALQVWALVLSKPEPGRMICGLGKRDVGADCGLPKLTGWVPRGTSTPVPVPADCAVTALNDQHAYIDGPHLPFEVGDLIGFGVSHPCTTFDKWRALLKIDRDYNVTGLVRTYF